METQRVVELFEADPSLFVGFIADLGGDPDEYGVAPEELSSITPTTAAAALAMFVSDLASVSPTWSALDVDEIDWVAVLTTVQDRFSSDMLGGLPSPGRDDNTEDPR